MFGPGAAARAHWIYAGIGPPTGFWFNEADDIHRLLEDEGMTEAQRERRGRFEKVAQKRAENAVAALFKLGRCANKAGYEYDRDDVEALLGAVEAQLERTRSEFERVLHKSDGPVKVSLFERPGLGSLGQA